jgi:hypothetical protein
MSTLERHFGSDASMAPQTVDAIARWLAGHAGRSKRVGVRPLEDRITRSAWFERKHRKVETGVWSLPSVKSPAQCAACHRDAEQGIFDDDDLILPQGAVSVGRRIEAR